MKLKDLEKGELRERILKQISGELFNEAEEIYKKTIDYKNFSWWGRIMYNSSGGQDLINIKSIQMKLLNREVKDALMSGDKK